MKEKLKAFLSNEKLRKGFKKAFSKKIIGSIILVFVLIAALKIGFSLIFEVNGIVKKVDTNSITVANFFTTKTVSAEDSLIANSKLQVGEKVKILKNLSGDIISIRTGHEGRGFKSGYGKENGRNIMMQKGQVRQQLNMDKNGKINEMRR